MWNYSEKMMDHFRNPRNVGKIDHPDGEATVGSLACGDALKFQFSLGPTEESRKRSSRRSAARAR